MQHALVLSRDGGIRLDDLPPEITEEMAAPGPAGLRQVVRGSAEERALLAEVLEATGWNRTRAAAKLGIDRTTLWRKIKEHGLVPEE